MKKRLFCLWMSLCLCFSLSLLVYADSSIGNLEEEPITDPGAGVIEALATPQGAVAIARNMSDGTTRYLRVNGDTLANNPSVERSTSGMIPAEVAYAAMEEGISINSIIGTDQRYKISNASVMPYCAIAFVVVYFVNGLSVTYSSGTGWMISPDTVVTAGHVLYNADLGWARSVVVMPGIHAADGNSDAPYGSATATEIAIHPTFYEFPPVRVENGEGFSETDGTPYDWGVIRLDEAIGNNSGYLGIRYAARNMEEQKDENGESIGPVVSVVGYPGDRNGGQLFDPNFTYYQYGADGPIYTDTSENASLITWRKFLYNIDATNGQSGAPILYEGKGIGIHVAGNNYKNRGVGITSQLYSFFLAYK